ncbi:hypothetical protein [Acinetobacter schindleri]|uniref:hypothetical protein n=1 Tax=Acinetobacter schindleri TaxID=108981 RepID=UPI0013B0779B|nr:hypothetical protein [Acinetobacter schindleri]MEB5929515.1 hypothetical protein [Acinetobacter schindleri]QIC60266.1 hypothetical protein FSC12_02300 [Acinetobacter schindleri]
MKKSENLIATLLAIYGILCAISIALYALIQMFVCDKPTATNLLIWSGTMFAPIAVLMTYTNWREQKGSELIAAQAKDLIIYLKEYKSQTNKLLALVLNNYLNDLDNEVIKKFLGPKIEPCEIRRIWGSLSPLRQNINDALSFINFNQNNQKIGKLIDEYLELTSKIESHIYMK